MTAVTNVRLFVTLLFTVQAAFLLADGWTTCVESRQPRRDAIRLGVFVFASAATYFLVQLALSTLVPDFPRLLSILARIVGPEAGHDGPPVAPRPAAVTLLVVVAFLVVTSSITSSTAYQDFLGSLTGGVLKLPRAMRDYFNVGAVCRITLDTDGSDRQNVPQP
jgi:hypothetical protein